MNNIDTDDELYLSELLTQCRFSLRAVNYLDLALNNSSKNSDLDEFWYHTQMFIVSVGNVSKMLYSNPHNKKLKKYITHHTNIMEKYELPKLELVNEIKLRNYFEHYDEKIVDWLQNTPSDVAKALNNVAPLDSFISGMEFSYLKHFDNKCNTLYLLDRSTNISEVYRKLVNLEQSLENILSNHYS